MMVAKGLQKKKKIWKKKWKKWKANIAEFTVDIRKNKCGINWKQVDRIKRINQQKKRWLKCWLEKVTEKEKTK